MTSFGLGEIGLVVLIALIFFDSKQVAKAAKWLRDMKTKIFHIQRDFKQQVDNLIEETEEKEEPKETTESKSDQRIWGITQVRKMTKEDKEKASDLIGDQLKKIPEFNSSVKVAAFASLYDEINFDKVLNEILASGKQLFLPYTQEGKMIFTEVTNLKSDLETGAYSIREPKPDLRVNPEEKFDLMIIPGRCFDKTGSRIGRGRGFYDKFLKNKETFKVGLCFDVQINRKKLNIEAHDEKMDVIISEKRIIKVKGTNDN